MKITDQFKQHLKNLGYQKGTVAMLPSCVAEFLEFCNYPKTKINELTADDVKKYLQHLQTRPNKRRPGGLSEQYINHQMYSLKVFFQWKGQLKGQLKEQLEEEQINERSFSNPMAEIQLKTPTKKARIILSLPQVKELYAAATTHKERAVLSLYYGCGLRRSEGVALQVNDIHFGKGQLFVRKGKNNTRRVVPLTPNIKQDLQNYLLLERGYQLKSNTFIVNNLGEKTNGNHCYRILKKLLEKSDLPKEITLHSLRHSIATHLLESGLSLEYVRTFLGHKTLETTQIYTHISTDQIKTL